MKWLLYVFGCQKTGQFNSIGGLHSAALLMYVRHTYTFWIVGILARPKSTWPTNIHRVWVPKQCTQRIHYAIMLYVVCVCVMPTYRARENVFVTYFGFQMNSIVSSICLSFGLPVHSPLFFSHFLPSSSSTSSLHFRNFSDFLPYFRPLPSSTRHPLTSLIVFVSVSELLWML